MKYHSFSCLCSLFLTVSILCLSVDFDFGATDDVAEHFDDEEDGPNEENTGEKDFFFDGHETLIYAQAPQFEPIKMYFALNFEVISHEVVLPPPKRS